jgi:hypothetical protein
MQINNIVSICRVKIIQISKVKEIELEIKNIFVKNVMKKLISILPYMVLDYVNLVLSKKYIRFQKTVVFLGNIIPKKQKKK